MEKYKIEKEVEVFSLQEMLSDPEKRSNLVKAHQPTDQYVEEYMIEALQDMTSNLEGWGFVEPDIHYNLSCSQGAGASFSFDNINVQKMIDNYPDRELAESLDSSILNGPRNTLEYIKDDIRCFGEFNSWSNHYTHKNTVDVKIDYPDEVRDDRALASIVNDVLETQDFKTYMKEILSKTREIYYDAANRVYQGLEDEWVFIHEESTIISEIKENDADNGFLSNGKSLDQVYNYPEYKVTLIESDTLVDHVTNFINSEESYVITNKQGKVLSYEDIKYKDTPKENFIFSQPSKNKEEIEKVISFSSINEANNYIENSLLNEYQVVSIEDFYGKE